MPCIFKAINYSFGRGTLVEVGETVYFFAFARFE